MRLVIYLSSVIVGASNPFPILAATWFVNHHTISLSDNKSMQQDEVLGFWIGIHAIGELELQSHMGKNSSPAFGVIIVEAQPLLLGSVHECSLSCLIHEERILVSTF
jgi:hypothetical protein